MIEIVWELGNEISMPELPPLNYPVIIFGDVSTCPLMNALIKLCIVMWDLNIRSDLSYFHNTIARMKFQHITIIYQQDHLISHQPFNGSDGT